VSNDPKKLPDRGLIILLTQISYGYPGGINVSRKIDPLVNSIMEGGMLPSPSQVEHIASVIEGYKQEDERVLVELEGDWQPLAQPRCYG
jgi:hypothetical protein